MEFCYADGGQLTEQPDEKPESILIVIFSYEIPHLNSMAETGIVTFYRSSKAGKRLLLAINYPDELDRLPFIYLKSATQLSFFLCSIHNV